MLQPARRHLEAIVRDSAGRQLARCLIRRGRYFLGQELKNEIVIDERSVSATHARLTVLNDDELFLEDQGSANGTFVDGAAAEGMTPLTLESQVQLGGCTLEFQRAGLPAAIFRHLPEGFLTTQRYRFGEIVVQGRASTIYEARDLTLHRDVAVKIMRAESQADPALVLRFVREAQISSQLQHTGILSPYEFGLNEKRELYYSTRFVEGDSLETILRELDAADPHTLRRHSLPSLLGAFQKVCDVVGYAHSRGVAHGGLTTNCITLGAYGEVMVVNWGGARVFPWSESNPHPVIAPPSDAVPALSAFTPPELLEGRAEQITDASDIYGLGAIFYHILTLRPPVQTGNEDDLRTLIFHGIVLAPQSIRPGALPHCPDGADS